MSARSSRAIPVTSAGALAPCLCALLDRRCWDGHSPGTLIHSKPQTVEVVIICHIDPAEEESVSRESENPLLSVVI